MSGPRVTGWAGLFSAASSIGPYVVSLFVGSFRRPGLCQRVDDGLFAGCDPDFETVSCGVVDINTRHRRTQRDFRWGVT